MKLTVTPPPTLRRRVTRVTTGIIGLVLLGMATLFTLDARLRSQLSDATDAFVEEQEIANRLTAAVMRQLLAVSSLRTGNDVRLRADFLSAGDEAYAQMRAYLFRNLSYDERLQLERVKEAHQRLEVSAARAMALFAGRDVGAGDASTGEMVTHATALLDAIAGFLSLREAELLMLRERQGATFRSLYAAGLLFAVTLLVAAVWLGGFLHSRVSTPLGELTEASNRIARGDLDVRVPESYDAEIVTLARQFNRMAASLKTLTSDLEGRNRELVDALTQVHAAQAELVSAEKLAAMGRMTAGVAHQLNNPLAAVVGFAELLQRRLDDGVPPDSAEVRDELLRPLLEEAQRAKALVGRFLQFSRSADHEVGPVRVQDALDVVLALRRFEIENANVRIHVAALPDVFVIGEQQRLQEALLNLINNSCEAMAPRGSGTIEIGAEVEGDRLVLHVQDDGPGVQDPDLVFEPFFTTKAVGEGAGLGLAIAHRFLEEFGGSIRVDERPGGGARFVLTFRLADAPHPAPRPHPEALSAPATLPRGSVVLVVEDEPHLRRLQERILGRAGLEVLTAEDVVAARRLVANHQIDLVVSDVKMPKESGLVLYEWLGEHAPHLRDRFLFVTGDTGDPEIAHLAQQRPEIFVRKPFSMAEYLDRLARALA